MSSVPIGNATDSAAPSGCPQRIVQFPVLIQTRQGRLNARAQGPHGARVWQVGLEEAPQTLAQQHGLGASPQRVPPHARDVCAVRIYLTVASAS